MIKTKESGQRMHAGSWVTCFLITLVVARVVITGQSAAQSTGTDPLVISGSEWITDAPTRIAAAANLFEVETGPPIRVEQADSGRQSLERLMTGQADFALMASVPLAMALIRSHHEDTPPESRPVILASVGVDTVQRGDHGATGHERPRLPATGGRHGELVIGHQTRSARATPGRG
ncbi:MAG: hypothetical protein WEB57_13805 [Pseudohongiellaceae bacterium]